MFSKIKRRFITLLKKWLEGYNRIHPSVRIPSSVTVNGSEISSNVHIGEGTTINKSKLNGSVLIGEKAMLTNAVLQGNIQSKTGCRFYHCEISGTVAIGKYTSVWGPNSDIIATEEYPVQIGSFCSIARNVSMQTFNHNHKKATSYFIGQNYFKEKWQNEKVSKGGISIANDVWIGAHSVILGGVTIANGAVVAANSVVTKDVPSYAIVAGSPAKVVGFRFENPIIEKLLELQWWNWSEAQMHKNKVFFENELTIDFINEYFKNE